MKILKTSDPLKAMNFAKECLLEGSHGNEALDLFFTNQHFCKQVSLIQAIVKRQ